MSPPTVSKPINYTQNHSALISLDKCLVVMASPAGRAEVQLLYVAARSAGVSRWVFEYDNQSS